MAEFTDRELMVIAAGREIHDGDLVFVGMRLPLIAFAFAKRTHAPDAVGLFENGLVRDEPAPGTLMTMVIPVILFLISLVIALVYQRFALRRDLAGAVTRGVR